MQNVTINLPRIAYEANLNDDRMNELLTDRIQLAAKAHLQNKEFISKILKMGKYGPLSLLAMELDDEPYYRLERASFLIGMLGLNEMVQYHTGEQLHESKDALMARGHPLDPGGILGMADDLEDEEAGDERAEGERDDEDQQAQAPAMDAIGTERQPRRDLPSRGHGRSSSPFHPSPASSPITKKMGKGGPGRSPLLLGEN